MADIKMVTATETIDSKMWDDFVFNHPNGNFFQSPHAYNFFKGISGYEPITFFASDKHGLKGILAVVMMQEAGAKGYFSRRCIVWGGPLFNDLDTFNLLLRKLVNHTKNKCIYTEFRNLFDTSNLKDAFKDHNFSYIEWLNFVVGIDTAESNRKKMNDSKKRQVNKSLKSGANILLAESVEQVKALYTLFKELYSDKIKKPLPSFNFFEKFYLDKKLGKIFIVGYENKVIGGAVCPIYKDRIYEWYVCGMDREIKNVYPSALATWAPIEYAANHGLKYFDFMGAGSPDADYGVREFKSQFGGELFNYGRYLRINKRLLYIVGKLGLKISSLHK